ncbi:MAG: efflux transporter periplasmic adaptor subunit, partial [Planctomycetaceae bacterium]|nr:efflux transporter periplasmic adaptor subunit [Planctomycetaceae bacterium]
MAQSAVVNVALDLRQTRAVAAVPVAAIGAERRRAGTRVLLIGALIVVVLASTLVAGTLQRLGQQQQLENALTQSATQSPRVTVALAQRMAPTAERVLPGNSLPLMDAALFGRATGYVSQRLVDIGDRVVAGQLLAVIDAPDIDDQLSQAKGNLEQAKANLVKAKADEEFAKIEEDRYRRLASPKVVAPEVYEIKDNAYKVAKAVVLEMEAAIKVNAATVQRFTDQQAFEKVTAPFAGVITARYVEKGDLIIADNTNREMFHLMQTDTLR